GAGEVGGGSATPVRCDSPTLSKCASSSNEGALMGTSDRRVVVGLDNGGNNNNATVLDTSGQFLVDRMVEMPSLVLQGPEVAVEALADAMTNVLKVTDSPQDLVAAVGLDTPGPASATGVISSKGSTNFSQ